MSKKNMNPYVSDYSEMYDKFREELQKWCVTGKEPKTADQDVRYYLDLEEKRLKKRNITIKTELKPYGQVSQTSKIVSELKFDPFDVGNYSQSQHHQSVEKTVSYTRNNQKLYSKKDDYTLYVTIIEPASKELSDIGKMDYVCPSCGTVSKVHILQQEGCPYCGGFFMISELFPKVSNYWVHKTVNIPEKFNSNVKKCILKTIPFTIIGFGIYLLLAKKISGWPYLIFSSVAGGTILGAIYGYFIFVGAVFYRLFMVARRDSKVLSGTKRGRKKITSFLSKYDPAFSYEYFQGKVLSLLRSIILAENPDNLLQYAGEKLDAEFKNYLHINYAGGMGVESAEIKDDKILLTLKVFLLNTVDKDKAVEERLEMLRVKMEHHASFKVDPNFSIQRVNCKGCGQSFNALKEKRCPYCGSEYHLIEDDWIVTAINR